MDRTFSTIAVLTMLLAAVGLCVKQTFDAWSFTYAGTITMLFAAEGITAVVVVAAGASVLLKRFPRRKIPLSRRPIVSAARA